MTDEVTKPEEAEDSTRSIVIKLRDESKKAEGAANVWRALGGIAATIAIAMAGAALTYAQQAAVDHEIVTRHEREIDGVRHDLDTIQSQLAAMTAILERVERRLDRREGTTP